MSADIEDWSPINPEPTPEPGSTHIPVSPEEDEMWERMEALRLKYGKLKTWRERTTLVHGACPPSAI